MEKLTDYILTLEHIIPTTLCDNIIKEYQSSKEWIGSTVYLKDDVPITAKDVRNCTGINMSHKEVIDKNKNIRKLLDNEVFECAKKSIEEYNKKFKRTCVTQDTGYNLLRYEPGGFYLEHVDSLLQEPRVISCSFIILKEENLVFLTIKFVIL